MNREIQDGLDTLFAKHEVTERAADERRQAQTSKEADFLREFLLACDTIIRPAMTAMGNYTEQRGYHYRIWTQTEGYEGAPGKSRFNSQTIGIIFFKGAGGGQPDYEYPGLSAYCDKSGQKVEFHERTMSPGRGGHAGSAGNAKISDLTEELIQRKILKVLAEVLT